MTPQTLAAFHTHAASIHMSLSCTHTESPLYIRIFNHSLFVLVLAGFQYQFFSRAAQPGFFPRDPRRAVVGQNLLSQAPSRIELFISHVDTHCTSVTPQPRASASRVLTCIRTALATCMLTSMSACLLGCNNFSPHYILPAWGAFALGGTLRVIFQQPGSVGSALTDLAARWSPPWLAPFGPTGDYMAYAYLAVLVGSSGEREGALPTDSTQGKLS